MIGTAVATALTMSPMTLLPPPPLPEELLEEDGCDELDGWLCDDEPEDTAEPEEPHPHPQPLVRITVGG